MIVCQRHRYEFMNGFIVSVTFFNVLSYLWQVIAYHWLVLTNVGKYQYQNYTLHNHVGIIYRCPLECIAYIVYYTLIWTACMWFDIIIQVSILFCMPYLLSLTWVANETTLDILSCYKQQVILNVKSDSEFTNSISCYERNRPVWIPWLQQKRKGSAAYIFQRLFCMGVSKKSSPLIRVASLLFALFDTENILHGYIAIL